MEQLEFDLVVEIKIPYSRMMSDRSFVDWLHVRGARDTWVSEDLMSMARIVRYTV